MKSKQVLYVRLILAFLLASMALGLLVVGVHPSALPPQGREVDNNIPKQVPIKVKLKSEKESKFKDLSNSNWVRDFELEVTNTSDKPIYFLELWLMLPDTLSENNNPFAFSLRYGRADFIHFGTQKVDTDLPIKPGETYTFVIPTQNQKGWDEFKHRTHASDPQKVRIKFVQLSFGDGSGFDGGGEAYPYTRSISATTTCRGAPAQPNERSVNTVRRNHSSTLSKCIRYTNLELIPLLLTTKSLSALTSTATNSATGRRLTTQDTRTPVVGLGTCFCSSAIKTESSSLSPNTRKLA
jgi:hypothetical protein